MLIAGVSLGEQAHTLLTVREFLAWDSGDDRHYELHSGQVVAMAPPSAAHTILAGNLARHLGNALETRPPCTVRSEAGILIDQTRWYQADLAVTCHPHRHGQQEVTEPLLIVEVLSPSTEDLDRKIKLPAYRSLASVRELMLIDARRMYCELHRRETDHWRHELLVSPDQSLRLQTADLELSLERLYANIELAPSLTKP